MAHFMEPTTNDATGQTAAYPAPLARQPTLYLDMDGVLADFDEGARRSLGTDNTYKWEWIHGTKAFWDGLNANPNFFADLPPMPDALLLIGHVRHLNPIVLTALPKTRASDVDMQKRFWIEKYFGPAIQVITCLTEEKPNYCEPGDILVDDRSVNRKAWTDRGGQYVLHTGAETTIAELRDWGVL